MPEPIASGSKLTFAPHGIFFIICSSSIFIACSGFSVGGNRKLTLALAFGISKLTASSVEGASIAKMLKAGSSHNLLEILSSSNKLISLEPKISFMSFSSSSNTSISLGVNPSIWSSPFSL